MKLTQHTSLSKAFTSRPTFHKLLCSILLVVMVVGCQSPDKPSANKSNTSDPLPSWNDGELKSAIIAYVTNVTDENSKDFIPVEDRIATFDNDGTLWAEKPLMQELFAGFRVKQMVAQKPELAKVQPFKAAIEHDKAYFEKGGISALLGLVVATHTHVSELEFEQSASQFMAEVTYPGRNVKAKQITYQPQLELLNYLREHGFKTYICTGGTIEFVRCFSNDLYGIPKEQVIGTSFQYQFVDSNRSIFRKPALGSFNDKEAKPVNIQLHLGRPPVFACGNEGGSGDIAMLKYCQSSKYPSFQLMVNHNDSIREYYYQEKDNASLNAATENKWHVISMKDDWKEVFVK